MGCLSSARDKPLPYNSLAIPQGNILIAHTVCRTPIDVGQPLVGCRCAARDKPLPYGFISNALSFITARSDHITANYCKNRFQGFPSKRSSGTNIYKGPVSTQDFSANHRPRILGISHCHVNLEHSYSYGWKKAELFPGQIEGHSHLPSVQGFG